VAGNRACKARAGSSGLKMKGDRVRNGALATPATFLAIPPSHEQLPVLPAVPVPHEQKSRFLQVRELHITGGVRPNLTYALKGDPIPVPVPETTTLGSSVDDFWRGVKIASGAPAAGPWDDSAKRTALQQFALWSIHKPYQTDVALLQQRDFYPRGLDDYLAEHCKVVEAHDGKLQCDPSSPPALDNQEILDRIIWKGDYIRIKSVRGSVLKSVLKESGQFSKAEKTPYSSISESGRPLIKLGIQEDEKNGGDYLINDKPLGPSAIYTVATSDYIALGDTGYPDLAIEPVGNPHPPASSSGEIITISGATCEGLPTFPSTRCNAKLNVRHYYDELVNRTPDDVRNGNTSWHRFYAWTYLHRSLGQRIPPQKGAPPGPEDISAHMQQKVDREKNWDLSLDKASIGFTAVTHNGSEQALSQEFAGVQNGEVNAKHSHSWAWDLNSKYTLFHTKYDLFTSEGMSYASSFTAQPSGPRSETQSRNQFAVDWGTYLHPWYKNKKFPQLSNVLSGHFETQLANPLTTISLSPIPPNTNSSTLTFKQGRTRLLLGRMGARFQDRKSFVEAGLEGGETLNAIQEFSLLTALGGPVLTCSLQATVSLSKCVNGFNQANPQTPVTSTSQVSVIRSAQPRYGTYWNIGLTVPINKTVSYNFQDSSDYFFKSSGDNSADTRFRHKLVSTVKVLVFPNLSFEPTYTIFLYENKIDYNFLVQQQYTVNMNYSFDWSNLHQHKQHLKYKKSGTQ
jgi:hypothetical protein